MPQRGGKQDRFGVKKFLSEQRKPTQAPEYAHQPEHAECADISWALFMGNLLDPQLRNYLNLDTT